MNASQTFDLIKQIFTPNGFVGDGFSIKIKNPAEITIDMSGNDARILFGKTSLPVIKFHKDFGIIKPSLSRNLSGLRLTNSSITFMIDGFPDLTFKYSELGL